MADTVRGDGLVMADRALASLVEDPQRHNSTRSQSPNPPKEERIYEAHENRTRRLHAGTNIYQLAYENVKKRWVEQGIWNDKWNKTASGRWKHEEPLELESESETDTEAGPQSDEEKRRRIAERRVTLEREREASRPFYQSVYQVSKERERIQYESGSGKAITTTTASADINTRAYENVNNTWIKRGIWNRNWGILPGMSWKHEEPLEEETADGPATVQANLLGNSSHEVEGAPIITMNGAPLRYISGRSVANLSESGIFMRNPPAAESNNRQGYVDSPGLENGDAEYSPLESNSAPPRRVASASLGPVHLSKVSKTPLKKRPGPRRRPNASEVPSGDPLLLTRPDITELLLQSASMPSRRSKRLQQLESSMAKDLGGIASTDSLKGIS
ncbi:hypothetical protein K469DRAFT_724733 [Zopfia rhizophila CBS 207.26]|uniref:Uncharacterized protein n=1 Tax=Zopfia rhizophila CBS 207.26 TaxID=1314779 RepID=A0A6A6EBF9_9PEZI|nr:hypothetical protein K469DRAFT_724733 [Zopfia rhizophila CBS 207.26]